MGMGLQARHLDGRTHHKEVAILLGWVIPLGGSQHWRVATRGRLYLRVAMAWGRQHVAEARGWACTNLGELPPRLSDVAVAGGPGSAHCGGRYHQLGLDRQEAGDTSQQ